ncbi:MAG: ABC transporter ATP-binding protein [Methylotenera sp.]|nr:ABC transporter ATP-binding protein [Methylotenera sp.]
MLLSLSNVSFSYQDKTILNNTSLSLDAGEVIAILGSNGAGKSTLLKLILGQVPLSNKSGEILLNGKTLSQSSIEDRNAVAYLPEQAAVYEHLTGFENVAYFLGLSLGKPASKEHIESALNKAGLQTSAWHQKCKHYSKGMSQKVMLALAIAKNSKLLLLDEPNSGLDPQATEELNNLLLSCKRWQMGVLVVTHDVLSALKFADRLYMLKQCQLNLLKINANNASLNDLQQLYLSE